MKHVIATAAAFLVTVAVTTAAMAHTLHSSKYTTQQLIPTSLNFLKA
jgi:hypothetical protein